MGNYTTIALAAAIKPEYIAEVQRLDDWVQAQNEWHSNVYPHDPHPFFKLEHASAFIQRYGQNANPNPGWVFEDGVLHINTTARNSNREWQNFFDWLRGKVIPDTVLGEYDTDDDLEGERDIKWTDGYIVIGPSQSQQEVYDMLGDGDV